MNDRFTQISPLGVPVSLDHGIKKHQAEDKLIKVIGDSHDVLIRTTTVFPFRLFPDTITVDRSKITITRRGFLNSAEVVTFQLEDILNVAANVGPIFGSLKISTKFFEPNKPYVIDYFWRSEALKVKRIVQGYLIARQKEVDCSVLTTRELSRMLDELGKVAPEEKV